MVDEIKVHANQRFDLLDMNRLKGHIQEALGNVLGRLMGNPNYYTGAARDMDKRPLTLCFPEVIHTAGLQLQISRRYVLGGHDIDMLMYGPDGERMGGPNSPVSKIYTVAPGPSSITRYLIMRRSTTDISSEARKHYSSLLGEYTTNVTTQTVDDYEISEALSETGVNSPASSSVALRDAGWVDIAVFVTDGVGSIVYVEDYVSGFVYPAPFSALGAGPLAYTLGGPAPDQYPVNVLDWLQGIQQIISRMRRGNSAWFSRHWWDIPDGDACFEELGGIRFGNGTTLVDNYARVLPADSRQVTIASNTMTANNTQHVRAKAFVSGSNNANPNVVSGDPNQCRGFIYSENLDGINNPSTIQKHWGVGMLHPKHDYPGAMVSGYWYNSSFAAIASPQYYELYLNPAPGASASKVVQAKINVPDKCRIAYVYSQVQVVTAFPVLGVPANNLTAHFCIHRFNRATNATDVMSDRQYMRSSGGIWSAGGYNGSVLSYLGPGGTDPIIIVDNENYDYYLSVYLDWDANTNITANTYVRMYGGMVATQIREASHVY